MSKEQLVWIVLDYKFENSDVNYLDSKGLPRIYVRDQYDYRSLPDMPYFDVYGEVISHFQGEPEEDRACQVSVDLLPEFGFKKKDIKKALENVQRYEQS